MASRARISDLLELLCTWAVADLLSGSSPLRWCEHRCCFCHPLEGVHLPRHAACSAEYVPGVTEAVQHSTRVPVLENTEGVFFSTDRIALLRNHPGDVFGEKLMPAKPWLKTHWQTAVWTSSLRPRQPCHPPQPQTLPTRFPRVPPSFKQAHRDPQKVHVAALTPTCPAPLPQPALAPAFGTDASAHLP